MRGGKGSVFDKGAKRVSARLLALTPCTPGPKRLTSRSRSESKHQERSIHETDGDSA